MARINTNVSALNAQRNLVRSYGMLNQTMEHLSTGLRISRGKDDPAGLIISERLRSEISAVGQAMSNTQRAKLIVATTESALDEVSSLLKDIQTKVVEAANEGALSDEEVRANQLQIDAAIDSITRIANSSSFGGRRVLDGSLHYTVSGVNTGRIAAQSINAAQFGSYTAVPITVQVIAQAQRASATFPFAALSTPVTIEVRGRLGATSLSFGSNSTVAQVASAIAAVRDTTGVSANVSGGAALTLRSIGYGSKEFATIKILSTAAGGIPDRPIARGANAIATVNGALAQADGHRLSVKTAAIDADLHITTNFPVGSSTTFNVTGGGALFQVGPRVNTNLQVNIGVPSMAASNLGNPVVGYLATLRTGGPNALVNKTYEDTSAIVQTAVDQVSILRGRLGAFERGTLDPNISQLGITMENLTSAESSIRDADFAGETSQLARNQILVNAGTTILSLANQTTQSVLRLLGG